MAAEKKQEGRSASTFSLRHPNDSPAATFTDSPSQNFGDSNPYINSSSPDPMPSDPPEIYMVSFPDSLDSVEQQVEENAVFLTPPEHQCRLSSEEEDQNPIDELCGDAARTVDLKRARVLDGVSEDQTQLKKRVGGKDVGETVVETERVDGAVVSVLKSGDSEKKMSAVNLADDALGGIGIMVKECVRKVTAIDEAHEPERMCRTTESEKHFGSSDLGGSSVIGKVGDNNSKLKCIIGDKGIDETGQGHGVGGVGKVAKAAKDGKMTSRDGNRIQEIDVSRPAQGNPTGGTSSVKGNTPEPMNENQKNDGGKSHVVGNERKNGGLMVFLDSLKVLARNLDKGAKDDDDCDFLETAKRQGITFPRPRWWPPEGESF